MQLLRDGDRTRVRMCWQSVLAYVHLLWLTLSPETPHTHTLDILVMLLIPCLSHCVTFKCFSRLYIAGDQFIWLGNKFPTIDTFLAYQIIFRLIFFSFVVCHHSGMFIIVVGILYCCCHFMFGYLMSWGWKMCEKSCVENIIIFFGLVL